jgi:hypothetical protein
VNAKLKDGIVKRGDKWSYVVRVADPETGLTRPKWVGGFFSEAAAKAARDEARVSARRGEYVNRDTVTVRDYLLEWLETHMGSVKPKTLAGYRYDVERYVIPRIGGQRLQGLRPAVVSKLYRDLASGGGRGGQPLSARSVEHVHRTLRKALNDAVNVEQLITTNPAERAKRPRTARSEAVKVWNPEQHVPGDGRDASAACLLPARRVHRSEARRVALPALVAPGARRPRSDLRRVGVSR